MATPTITNWLTEPPEVSIQVNHGAGGKDARDWSRMLGRMYARWGWQQGYKTSMGTVVSIDLTEGDETTEREFTIVTIEGSKWLPNMLRAEEGTHRLVRISPFDSDGRRQTTFATVSISRGGHCEWRDHETNQIRSYVLDPYTLVKDMRTEVETKDARRVLDGDLSEFLEAGVRWRAANPIPQNQEDFSMLRRIQAARDAQQENDEGTQ